MTIVAVAMVAVGAWLWSPATSRRRLPGKPRAGGSGPVLPELAAASAGLAVALVVGGLTGLLAGVATGVVARAGLRHLVRTQVGGDDSLARQAPDAVDCLASCLAAGAPLWPAMRIVAEAFGDPLRTLWTQAASRHALGSPADEAFAEWLSDPMLGPVGRVLIRSSDSGAALTTSLVGCAEHLREQRTEALEVRARAVGVKVVAPLAVCFLPAFVLLAVVPIIGSLVQRIL